MRTHCICKLSSKNFNFFLCTSVHSLSLLTSQVNEFSVEPPGHSDDDYEVMEQAQAELQTHLQPGHKTHTESQTQINSHRPLSLDIDNRHTKSLSLPYMTSPVHGPEESCSEEEVVGEYSDDNDYSSEDESMFIKSLPPDFFLNNMNEFETDGCTLDRIPEGLDQSKRESESLHSEFSACKEPTAADQEQREVKDEEEGEGDEDGQEREEVTKKEEEDTVNQGGDQPERNMQR